MEDSKLKIWTPDPPAHKSGDSTTGIFVSLYLIVLAFFVVLNSISNQVENKVNAATESVTRAFSNKYAPKAEFIDVVATESADTPNDEFYNQIKGLFASLVGFESKFPTGGGDVIKVSFKKELLFLPASSEFRTDQNKFFTQLVSFLNDGQENEKREIDFLLYSGEVLPAGPEYWQELGILRAGAIVHALKPLGVKEDQLSIGLVPGDNTLLSITFYSRDKSLLPQRQRETKPSSADDFASINNQAGRIITGGDS